MRRYLRRVPKGFDDWAKLVLRPATYEALPYSYSLRLVIEAFYNRNGPTVIEDAQPRPAERASERPAKRPAERPAEKVPRRGYRMVRRAKID